MKAIQQNRLPVTTHYTTRSNKLLCKSHHAMSHTLPPHAHTHYQGGIFRQVVFRPQDSGEQSCIILYSHSVCILYLSLTLRSLQSFGP